MSIWECVELLNEFVDESDPDLDEPQIEHLLQSAEAIRRDYPDQDWLHLTALIHGIHPSPNPDYNNSLFRTRLGVYTENCGLDKVTMSWGHDEYMYLQQVRSVQQEQGEDRSGGSETILSVSYWKVLPGKAEMVNGDGSSKDIVKLRRG
ncbi:hypothetical protein BHM03_00027512 [Ensete ventricosum]|nr:hypothetical protein BHM03_00027512 [Ensete ventricosum]